MCMKINNLKNQLFNGLVNGFVFSFIRNLLFSICCVYCEIYHFTCKNKNSFTSKSLCFTCEGIARVEIAIAQLVFIRKAKR